MQVIISSRVDPLPLLDCGNGKFFIKRDDLLPNGGSKTRKYASLLPYLLKNGCKHVHLKGGKKSNHIHYFSKLLQQEGIEISEEGFVIEEGGSQKESVEGAMSLAADIYRNEEELGIRFDHVVIDAGSGFMAASLLVGLTIPVHVLQLAPLNFEANCLEWFGQFPKERCQIHIPSKWKSFGAFTKPLLRFIADFKKKTGIPLDPIYSGKLIYFLPEITKSLRGNILVVHQGISYATF